MNDFSAQHGEFDRANLFRAAARFVARMGGQIHKNATTVDEATFAEVRRQAAEAPVTISFDTVRRAMVKRTAKRISLQRKEWNSNFAAA